MNSQTTIASPLKETTGRRFLAALACLFLLIAGPAFAQGTGPGPGTGDGDDGASGDETVGTLPSVRDDDPPPPGGPIGIPSLLGFERRSADGALILEGPAPEILDLLARSRQSGLVGVQLGLEGRARAVLLGDFQLRVRPELLASLQVDTLLTTEQALATRVTWNRRSNARILSAGSSLTLPLSDVAASPALRRSPLVIESLTGTGETTRLSMGLEDGLVVLTQTRR